MPPGSRRILAAALGALQLTPALAATQSAVHPGGHAARLIAESWWIMLWGSVAILALVMGLAGIAMFRTSESRTAPNETALIIGGGIALPAVVLTALLVYGAVLGRELTAPAPGALAIEVTGRQWWWEVRYPETGVVTANEIRIPARRTVSVTLKTEDVIHSFWVPALAGKIDLIPGQPNRLRLHADQPGLFRGQCAEFCGDQHALMGFYVFALEGAEYDRWLALQREPPAAPETDIARRGRDAFLRLGCAQCHTIRGTQAQGRGGPDLTHVASRPYLAAGTLENNPGNVARWIADNARIKPGIPMPAYPELPETTLRELTAYIGSLK